MKLWKTVLGAACASFAMQAAHAQALPATKLQVVGSISSLPQYKEFEVPFWTKTLGEKSGGAITA